MKELRVHKLEGPENTNFQMIKYSKVIQADNNE